MGRVTYDRAPSNDYTTYAEHGARVSVRYPVLRPRLLPLEHYDQPPSERSAFPDGELFMGGTFVSSGAGNAAHVQLFNPLTSFEDVFLEYLWCESASGNRLRFTRGTTAMDTLDSVGRSRSRRNVPALAQIRTRDGSQVIDTQLSRAAQPANDPVFQIAIAVVLPPGEGFTVLTDSLATNLGATFFWRARRLDTFGTA